jgi:hypothetical protein
MELRLIIDKGMGNQRNQHERKKQGNAVARGSEINKTVISSYSTRHNEVFRALSTILRGGACTHLFQLV